MKAFQHKLGSPEAMKQEPFLHDWTREELERMDDDRGERECYRMEDARDDHSNPPEILTDVEKDSLTLKWGTLKAWGFHSEDAEKLLREYDEIGASMSAMMQHDTPRQKEIICELIDIGNFDTVYLDWDGIEVSKEKAKEYVIGYGQNK